MRRDELEHVIRAAAAITGDSEMSSSAPRAPRLRAHPTRRPGTDDGGRIYPLRHLADVIDGAIGELSPFHETFRYYAHGVGPTTAVLPAGWQDRLVKVQNEGTRQYIGYCLDPCDLAASKLAAGREKDSAFVEGLLRHRIVTAEQLLGRIGLLPLDAERRRRLELQVVALGKTSGHGG